jgi:hypothetical protein
VLIGGTVDAGNSSSGVISMTRVSVMVKRDVSEYGSVSESAAESIKMSDSENWLVEWNFTDIATLPEAVNGFVALK